MKILNYLERRQNRKIAHELSHIYTMQGDRYQKSDKYLLALNCYYLAVEIWNTAIERFGDDKYKYAYSCRGHLHEKLENFQKACRDYEMAASLGDSFAHYQVDHVAQQISSFCGFEFFRQDNTRSSDGSGPEMIQVLNDPDPEMIRRICEIDLEDLKMQVEALIIEGSAIEHPEMTRKSGLGWIKNRNDYKERADYCYLMEDFDVASELYTRILDGDYEDNETLREYSSEHLEIYMRRAIAHDELGKFENAINDYGEILRTNPELTTFYIKRGKVRTLSGDFTEAMRDYSKAFEQDGKLKLIFDESITR